jgi:hypothetical protein
VSAPFYICKTAAIPANTEGHFVRYTLDPNCTGDVWDVNGAHVGPWGAWGTGRIWGLYSYYYLEVACVLTGVGMISNTI